MVSMTCWPMDRTMMTENNEDSNYLANWDQEQNDNNGEDDNDNDNDEHLFL